MKIKNTYEEVLRTMRRTSPNYSGVHLKITAEAMGVEFMEPPLTFDHIAGGERFKYMGACCIKLNSRGMAWNCKAEVAMSLLQEAIVTRGWE